MILADSPMRESQVPEVILKISVLIFNVIPELTTE